VFFERVEKRYSNCHCRTN